MQTNGRDTCSPSEDAQETEEDNGVSIFIPKALKFDEEEEKKQCPNCHDFTTSS